MLHDPVTKAFKVSYTGCTVYGLLHLCSEAVDRMAWLRTASRDTHSDSIAYIDTVSP